MKHSDITIGTVYHSATGTYVVTEANTFTSYTSVTLDSGTSSFTTNVVNVNGPRAYAWEIN